MQNLVQKRVFFFILLFFLSCFNLFCSENIYHNQPFLLSEKHNQEDCFLHICYYIDSTNCAEFSLIEKFYNKDKFTQNGKNTPNFGIMPYTAWFHIAVTNKEHSSKWLFEVDFANYNYICFYFANSNFSVVSKQEQGLFNLSKRDTFLHRVPLFETQILRDSVYHLFFKIKTISPTNFPLKIYTNHSFIKEEKQRRDISFLFIGIVVATAIFNLIFFFLTREKSYVFLSLHLWFVIFNATFNYGFGYEYFNHLNEFHLSNMRFYFYGIAGLFHALFMYYYLELKYYVVLKRVVGIMFLFFASFLVGNFSGILAGIIVTKLAVISYFVFSIISIFVGFYLLVKKFKPARYFVGAFGIHLISSLLFVFSTIGVFQFSLINLYSQLVATAIFGLLLSIGLSEKISAIRKEQAKNAQLNEDKKDLLHEIEERQKIEIELRESENKFKTLFELLPQPLLLTDFETGTIFDVNVHLCKISGYKREDLIGQLTTKIAFWEEETRTEFLKQLEITGYVFGAEFLINIKGGKKLPVLMYSETIYLKNKKTIFTIAVDISKLKEQETELKETGEQLRILNNTKDKFFSIIAHDLQNPMQVMIAYSKELEECVNEKDEIRLIEYINIMKSVSESTYNLLQNLLTWARIQTGLMRFNPEQIHAKTLLNSVQFIFSNMASSKQIRLAFLCSDELIIWGDNNMILSLLRNLISNAIKFTETNGSVKVIVSRTENQSVIEVSDTGIGIPENIKNKLFLIDQNVHTQGTNDETGTGIGLILCKEFVQLHNGKIEIESIQGHGSTFTVYLPQINY